MAASARASGFTEIQILFKKSNFAHKLISKTYSAPFKVIPYTEEPFSHHWWTPHPPKIRRSLLNVPPTPHKDIFAQLTKMCPADICH